MTRGAIVFGEYYFYPEGWAGAEFPRAIAARWVAAGLTVRALCGSEVYIPVRGKVSDDPADAGVGVTKMPRLPLGIGGRIRLLGYLWFTVAAMFWMLFTRRPDLYVSQTNPPMFLPVIAAVATIRRRPLIVIAQDIYPDVLSAHSRHPLARLMISAAGPIFSWAYRSARYVVSLGPTMTSRLQANGVAAERVREISNWAAGEPAVPAPGRLRERTIVYTGNLGTGHEFDTLVRAFALSGLGAAGYRLRFVGRVGQARQLMSLVRELGVESFVTLEPHLPDQSFDALVRSAALAVCTMKRGFEGVVVPSKVLGYLARGAPVLYIGPGGDVSRLLADSGGGIWYENGDVSGVAGSMRLLGTSPDVLAQRGQDGADFYWRNLSRDAALRKYAALAADCLAIGVAGE